MIAFVFRLFSFLTSFPSLVVRKSRYCYSQFLLCSNVAFCVHCSVMKFMALALIFQWRIFNALAHTKHNVTILQSTWNRLELKLDGPGKQGFVLISDMASLCVRHKPKFLVFMKPCNCKNESHNFTWSQHVIFKCLRLPQDLTCVIIPRWEGGSAPPPRLWCCGHFKKCSNHDTAKTGS